MRLSETGGGRSTQPSPQPPARPQQMRLRSGHLLLALVVTLPGREGEIKDDTRPSFTFVAHEDE